MMRVLHVANFGWKSNGVAFYSTDHKITGGLRRMGCHVVDFSYRDIARLRSPLGSKWGGVGAMNRQLRQAVEQLRPQLLLLGHCELVQPPTLARLRDDFPQMRIARWWVDAFQPHKLPVIEAFTPWLDAFFTSHSPDFVRAAVKEVPPALAWLPPLCDVAVENRRAWECPQPSSDLFFAGSPWPDRNDLHGQLRRLLPDRRLALYGEAGQRIVGQDYMEAIGAARSGLNVSIYNDAPFYSSDRLIHLLANGTLVISARVPGLDGLFADEEELLFFDDVRELPDLLAGWLADDSRRRAVAQRGWQRAHGSFGSERVCRWLLDVATGRELSDDWEWKQLLLR